MSKKRQVNIKPEKEGHGIKPETDKPEMPDPPGIRVIKESSSSPVQKELSIDEAVEKQEALLLLKAREIEMLESQYKEMIRKKNEPTYFLTEFLFSSFCQDEEYHLKWKQEGNNWEGELHSTWFGVGNAVLDFIRTNKDKLRL